MANVYGMQNTILNGLQLYRTKYFHGLTDENMLSQALLVKPHVVSNVLSYIFGTMDQQSSVDFLTGGLGRTLTIENREFEWSAMVEADKAITIKDAKWQGSSISSTDVPGINGTPIQVWVSERAFGPGAIVEFDDKEYQARVMGEPYQDGHDWVYTLQVADSQSTSYIPPSLLADGKQLSRVGSAYEEGSYEADIISYQAPVKLRNHLTTMRLKYDITGSAAASVMIIEMRDPKTKKSTRYWTDYQEWLALRQWYRTVDYQLVYSRYNARPDGTTPLKGTSGRPVYLGAGLLQQISPANKRTYTKLTDDLLEDFLTDLSYNIRGMNERRYVALTGEMGMKELDRVLKAKASGYTLIDTKFVTGTGQNLTFGGQFTTWNMLNGVVLTLKHFPLYDSLYHGRKLHPTSGKPVESYRMTFVDMSMRDGESNIVKVVRKGREMVMWSVAGAVAPGQGFSNNRSTVRSNGYDGYTVHFLGEMGIMLKDPTTSGELILDVD
jgi:hypothetical protein